MKQTRTLLAVLTVLALSLLVTACGGTQVVEKVVTVEVEKVVTVEVEREVTVEVEAEAAAEEVLFGSTTTTRTTRTDTS